MIPIDIIMNASNKIIHKELNEIRKKTMSKPIKKCKCGNQPKVTKRELTDTECMYYMFDYRYYIQCRCGICTITEDDSQSVINIWNKYR